MDTHQSSPASEPGTSQDSVRACVSCARAKAKCVSGGLSLSSCERCSRLQRPCEPAPPRARTHPRKRKALEVDHLAKHRVEKLEERLDGIVTLLQASSHPATKTTEVTPPLISRMPTIIHPSFETPQQQSHLTNPDLYFSENAEHWDERLLRGGTIRQRFALIGSYNPAIDAPDTVPQPGFNINGVDFGAENPEKLLHIFKDEMNPNFPFISIPNSATVGTMRKDQPSLLTAIMAVSSRDSPNQFRLGRLLMQQIADRVVVNGERNLDILLAILTYAGWCYHHFFNIPQLTSLISLASTLVADLRLMKPLAKDTRGFFDAAIRDWAKAREQCIDTLKPVHASVRLIEERRAALGYWFLTSIVGSFFQRIETAKWSSYLDECCTIISKSGHHRHDKYAVALIKLQKMSEKIYQNPWHGASEGHSHVAPPVLYLKSLEVEIKTLRSEILAEMESNPFLLLHYHSLEVSLYKIGLARSERFSAFTIRDFSRLEYLFACSEAVRAFSDGFLNIAASKYHCMPIKLHMELTWNLSILQMLSTFDHPDWNIAWLRELISLPKVLGKLSTILFEAKAALDLDPSTTERLDIFSQSAKKMSWIKMFVEKAIPGMSSQEGESRASEVPINEMFDLNGGEFMGYMDDAWMKDIIGPWEY
ncbi:hypothetical protein BKA65DRAFT_272691 [Rhexocercosporidium sp. MPI-PUGE-AT-0058]|nr:hypothetical protein BKA65DRAFT_272691 [Rhexocercosporidium sp. MPI-PUGE-AT-0058]